MPSHPNDRVLVVRDSQAALWEGVKDGLIHSSDVTASGRLRPSLTPTPRDSVVKTPFGMQNPPSFHSSKPPPNPPNARSAQSQAPPKPRRPFGEIDVNVLRVELAREDAKRKAEDEAIAKILEGAHALLLARKL